MNANDAAARYREVVMTALADFAGMDEGEIKVKIADDFEIPVENLDGCKIIVAYMSEGSWGCDSSAFILFAKDGELYEVNGSHCSCYGFSGDGSGTQWQPEAVPDVAAIIGRKDYALAGGGYDDDSEGNSKAIRSALAALSRGEVQ